MAWSANVLLSVGAGVARVFVVCWVRAPRGSTWPNDGEIPTRLLLLRTVAVGLFPLLGMVCV